MKHCSCSIWHTPSRRTVSSSEGSSPPSLVVFLAWSDVLYCTWFAFSRQHLPSIKKECGNLEIKMWGEETKSAEALCLKFAPRDFWSLSKARPLGSQSSALYAGWKSPAVLGLWSRKRCPTSTATKRLQHRVHPSTDTTKATASSEPTNSAGHSPCLQFRNHSLDSPKLLSRWTQLPRIPA